MLLRIVFVTPAPCRQIGVVEAVASHPKQGGPSSAHDLQVRGRTAICQQTYQQHSATKLADRRNQQRLFHGDRLGTCEREAGKSGALGARTRRHQLRPTASTRKQHR